MNADEVVGVVVGSYSKAGLKSIDSMCFGKCVYLISIIGLVPQVVPPCKRPFPSPPPGLLPWQRLFFADGVLA